MKTFVIAEIGVNHNGSLDLAIRSVEEAVEAGASAVKFQTFTADALVARNTAVVQYQRDGFGAEDQHAMLRELELTAEGHQVIARRCAELGIEFMSTAFDSDALDMLCACGIRRVKIPSGEITNIPFLTDCASRGLPVILSTGMADLGEVGTAVDVVRRTASATAAPTDAAGLPPLTVLHCTSAYPTDPADANLRAMTTIGSAFGVAVGYSDHTLGIAAAPLAVALGARLIEKHFTLDRSLRGPDHGASLEPQEFAAMVKAIAEAETVLGDGCKQPRPAEMEARALVRRGLKAARDLKAGERLGRGDVAILRPATGLPPAMLDKVVGRQLVHNLTAGSPIENDHLR